MNEAAFADPAPAAGAQGQPKLNVMASRQFPDWLNEANASLAFSTYQAGKLFLIGMQPKQGLSIFQRNFARCMGLWSNGNTVLLASLYQLWRLENALPKGRDHKGFDKLYVPRTGYVTGDIDIHDVALDGQGRIVFVNTLYNCLATVSDRASFTPIWMPPFISKLAAEDRCHMNGLALEDGEPAYVTAVSQADVSDGWRDRRKKSGIVMDVRSNEVVVNGLSMPHSPRMHQGKLWLLDSGTGYFGYVDRKKGKFERVAFCPGYSRGLGFIGDYAVIGLSKMREKGTFGGLDLENELKKRDAEPRCGLLVVDLNAGDAVHWLRIDGMVSELFEVTVLPGVKRPMALGFQTDEIRRMITPGPPQPIGGWAPGA